MTQPDAALPDQPPAAVKPRDIESKLGKFSAHLVGPDKATTVYSGLGAKRKKLWSVEAWSPIAFLGDVGPTLALGHPGSNLLPPDAAAETIVVTFYRDGKKLREVRLGEIEPMSALHMINGRLSWGVHYGFDDKGNYLIERQDGSAVTLDPAGK